MFGQLTRARSTGRSVLSATPFVSSDPLPSEPGARRTTDGARSLSTIAVSPRSRESPIGLESTNEQGDQREQRRPDREDHAEAVDAGVEVVAAVLDRAGVPIVGWIVLGHGERPLCGRVRRGRDGSVAARRLRARRQFVGDESQELEGDDPRGVVEDVHERDVDVVQSVQRGRPDGVGLDVL